MTMDLTKFLWNRMSLFRNSKYSPAATSAPLLNAGANPKFLWSGCQRAPNLRTITNESSVEALSTTMTSK